MLRDLEIECEGKCAAHHSRVLAVRDGEALTSSSQGFRSWSMITS